MTLRDKPPLKVALVHDWLTGMRGGEKVLELICRMYPEAPLYTLLAIPGAVTSTIQDRPLHTSALQYLPLAAKRYRHYLPLFPLFAEFNKVRGVDLVISTSHAVAKSMVVKKRRSKKPLHICYIHTPMRYVWDRFDDYFGPERVGWFFSKFFFAPIAWYLRLYDRWTLHRVDQFVANSSFVAKRVKEFYNRDALVLPAPVNLQRFSQVKRAPQEWYLIVSALVPYKKVDHAIRAAAALGKKLVIVGTGPEEKNLLELAQELHAQVKFAGSVDNNELMNYYGQAKALLFPGVEDFGIVPLEAIASGCPVIALAEGGVLDSMTSLTAIFYKDSSPEGLKNAMEEFERQPGRLSEKDLRDRAVYFSEENFMLRFREIVQGVIEKAHA